METLLNVRTLVRDNIDEPVANYWSDAELNRKISERQLDLWRKILQIRKDYFLGTFTLTLVVGQYRYTPPAIASDIWRIETIRTTSDGYQGLIWSPMNANSPEFQDGLRSDVPVYNPYRIYYSLRNVATLDISPLPQQVIAAQVDYIQLPTAVAADADTFLIPDPFLAYIQYAATADALAKGPVGDVAHWLGRAADAWKDIMQALDTPREDQGPDVVLGAFQDAEW